MIPKKQRPAVMCLCLVRFPALSCRAQQPAPPCAGAHSSRGGAGPQPLHKSQQYTWLRTASRRARRTFAAAHKTGRRDRQSAASTLPRGDGDHEHAQRRQHKQLHPRSLRALFLPPKTFPHGIQHSNAPRHREAPWASCRSSLRGRAAPSTRARTCAQTNSSTVVYVRVFFFCWFTTQQQN